MAGKRNYPTSRKTSVVDKFKDWIHFRPEYVTERISKWNIRRKATSFPRILIARVEQKPFRTLFALIAVLFLLILAGNFLRRPKPEKKIVLPSKIVEIYRIGAAPKIKIQAQVEKTGLIKITALSPGVISRINVAEGQIVAPGTQLISLSTNYSGGNTASLQRELAATQYQNVKDTYNTQKDIIQRQRDAAEQNNQNAVKLRDITNQSVSDTQNLINLNNDILSTLNSNLQTLQNNNQNGANNQMILSTKQQISQFEASVTQLKSGLSQSQYQADANNPPGKLANIQRDIALKQLDVQQKALGLSLNVSRIQLSLAQVMEAAMFPAAPFAGVIERIYVTAGQSVNPGTPLLELHGEQDIKIVAKVSADIASSVSKVEAADITLPNGKVIRAAPVYISTESTDGPLYSVIFTLSKDFQDAVSDRGYVTVDIPVGYADTSSSTPFIPLDSVYQTQSSSYIFVNQGGKARSKTVTLGQVYGQYVSVLNGLSAGDEVIVSRTVLNGDRVSEK